LARWRATAVIDADAIRAAADLDGKLGRALLTPHSGEFKGLTGRSPGEATDIKARARAAQEAAKSLRTALLLKGHITVITDGKRTKLNDAGVSAMAVGGTGDVLTGIVGALLSKGLSPYDAGRVGAFIGGAAGQVAFGELGHSLKPTDLITSIPRVMARHLDWWGGKP
jgi:NAD(P)H-hydrate epimerase